jgi:hypothetical protein
MLGVRGGRQGALGKLAQPTTNIRRYCTAIRTAFRATEPRPAALSGSQPKAPALRGIVTSIEWDCVAQVSSHIRGVRDVWLRLPRSFSLYHHVGRLESGVYLLPSKLQPRIKSLHGCGEHLTRVNQSVVHMALAIFADRQTGGESSGSYFGCSDLDDVTLVGLLNPISEVFVAETRHVAIIAPITSPSSAKLEQCHLALPDDRLG